MATSDSVSNLGITEIRSGGFKSLVDDCRLPVRPLTIIAGANSSGKSSAIQPLLMLKQTLEAAYDPGPLLLSGPHVRFTASEQILSSLAGRTADRFYAGIRVGTAESSAFVSFFEAQGSNGFRLCRSEYRLPSVSEVLALEPQWDGDEIARQNPDCGLPLAALGQPQRHRFFLVADWRNQHRPAVGPDWLGSETLGRAITGIIHVPGLRGNPARSYPATAVGEVFPGTFETYTASVIHSWQEHADPRLEPLSRDLLSLGLTDRITTERIDAAQVEVRVGRLPVGPRPKAAPTAPAAARRDLVNVADVGFGVSQTLPVVVALLVAQPGQLVYLEQPEIHLHPRAQVALASVLAEAAGRGVRVVAETHSALLLLAVQTLVARGEMPASELILHWFERGEDGATRIRTAELDDAGSFGDWPEDFGRVTLETESRYLDAVEDRGEIRHGAS